MSESWIILALAGAFALVVVVLIALFVAAKGRYYRKLFDPAHFRELHERLAAALERAEQLHDAERAPSVEDGTAFVTSAGLAVGVSAHRADGERGLHISMSQASGPTTTAAASQFGFFMVTMLNKNKMALSPFCTPSRVHHLVFSHEVDTLELNDFDATMEQHRSSFQPIPFQQQPLA